MTSPTYEHRGFHITIDAHNALFVITEEPLHDSRHTSFLEAKEAIDSHITKTELEKKKAAVLALPVVTGDGTVTAIKGIHAAQGHILTADKREHRDIYVDRPWVRELVARKRDLLALLEPINKQLTLVSIRASRTFGRNSTATYIKNVEALEDEYREIVAVLDKAGH